MFIQLCITFATALGVIATPIDSGLEDGNQGLTKRRGRGNQQVIFNPCPEFLGGMSARQSCESRRCGGDTNIKGVCNNLWPGGLQDDRCYMNGGCGSFCLCIPDSRYANGPSVALQFIGIECPETYGLPKQKCSDPKCGGNVYFPGFCDNILVSGAQGPGCPKPGCGKFCQCDPTIETDSPASASSDLHETTTSFWLTGTTTATVRFLLLYSLSKPQLQAMGCSLGSSHVPEPNTLTSPLDPLILQSRAPIQILSSRLLLSRLTHLFRTLHRVCPLPQLVVEVAFHQ